MLTLRDFSMQRPRYEIAQQQALDWLTAVHAQAEATREGSSLSERDAFAVRFRKLVQRCACGPDKIRSRGHVLADLGCLDFDALDLYDVKRHPHGQGTAVRSRLYSEIVNDYFAREYAPEVHAPSELIHVTCTGYVAPSGAQRLVADKGWGDRTQVTHAYHMGCYAAFPAVRIAAGQLSLAGASSSGDVERRADIVHTELCTLHLDPSDHSAEQCVVQSLFADGFIRYSVHSGPQAEGLELLALAERILPDSAGAMTWSASDFGLAMTLSRDVPARIASVLRSFVFALFNRAGLDLAVELRKAVVAVHPGGPKIIDRVGQVLELNDAQLVTSRDVLRDYGNMSSATLPHVWQRLLADDGVRPGTVILSLAFGPGLTVCGGLFRKH